MIVRTQTVCESVTAVRVPFCSPSSLSKVDLKILVGLFGVGMVLVAVLAALGLLSYIGIMGSLIIIEVVPFLVLAVGVDNLFILVHSYEVICCSLTLLASLLLLLLLPISPLPYSSVLFPLLLPPFFSLAF